MLKRWMVVWVSMGCATCSDPASNSGTPGAVSGALCSFMLNGGPFVNKSIQLTGGVGSVEQGQLKILCEGSVADLGIVSLALRFPGGGAAGNYLLLNGFNSSRVAGLALTTRGSTTINWGTTNVATGTATVSTVAATVGARTTGTMRANIAGSNGESTVLSSGSFSVDRLF